MKNRPICDSGTSQINDCAVCVDMHTKEGTRLAETWAMVRKHYDDDQIIDC